MNKKIRLAVLLMIWLLLFRYSFAYDVPGASIGYNQTETKSLAPADLLNTSGGSFTTMNLYAETQNYRWKAYAGNVTGTLVLDDAGDYTIYNWQSTVTTGKVYASRNDTVNWDSIGCADLSMIYNEETVLGHTTADIDSINSTFSYRAHSDLIIAGTFISQNTCPSTATWTGDAQQTIDENALFQEFLLDDDVSLIYGTKIEDTEEGFNFEDFDFQMIVAERTVEAPAVPYYFWLELI